MRIIRVAWVLSTALVAWGQNNNIMVFKRDLPAPDRPDQWVMPWNYNSVETGATLAAGWFPVSSGFQTLAQANAAADAWMLSPEFESICDKSWQVFVNDKGVVNVCKACVPGNGFRPTTGPKSCREAMTLAFPGNIKPNDCRITPLRSIPGASMFWDGQRWVSTTGTAIVIPVLPPNKPVIPAGPLIPPGHTGPIPGPAQPLPPWPPPGRSANPPPATSAGPSRAPAPANTAPGDSDLGRYFPRPGDTAPPAPPSATRSEPVGGGRWALVATTKLNPPQNPPPSAQCSHSESTFQTSYIDSDNTQKQAQLSFQAPPVISSTEDSRLLARGSGNAWANGYFYTGPLKIVKSDYAPENPERKPQVNLMSGALSSHLELVVRMDPKGPDTFDITFVAGAYCYGGAATVVRYTYRRDGAPARR